MPRELVERFYSRREVVEAYADRGIERAERTLIDKHFAPGGRILDVGTGRGRVASYLAGRGYTVVGIDLSSAMIEAARADAARLGAVIDYVCADAVRLQFENASFDGAIFAGNGISHLEPDEQERALTELTRVLRPRATLILAIRTPYALNRLLPGLVVRALRPNRQRRAHESISNGVYVNRPSVRAMARMLRQAGFTDVTSSSFRDVVTGRRGTPLSTRLGGQFYLTGRGKP